MKIIMIIVSTVLGATGQILMKKGMMIIGKLDNAKKFSDYFFYYLKSIFSPYVFSGLLCYVISMIIWLWILSQIDLSYARPIVALGYVIVTLYSYFFLNETFGWDRWVGIILIIIGVILVARS